MTSGAGHAGWADMGRYHCRGALYCAEPGTGNTYPVLSFRRCLRFTLSVRTVQRKASFQAWSHRKPEPAFPGFYCRVCQQSDLVQPDENLSDHTARRIIFCEASFGVLAGMLFLDEQPQPGFVWGTLLILSGIVIVSGWPWFITTLDRSAARRRRSRGINPLTF